MRILLTALLATMFLTGCPEDKKDDKAKDTKSDTAAPKDSAAKKDKGDSKDEEGGW